MNVCVLKGKVVNDPQIYNTDKYHLTKIVLAVPRPGMEKSKTDFIGIDFFGKVADVVAQYITKGADLAVQGHIQANTKGNQFNKTIIGDTIGFFGGQAINIEEDEEYNANNGEIGLYSFSDPNVDDDILPY